MNVSQSLPDLIEKYQASIPRYTSYPTAIEFHPGVDGTAWQHALRDEFDDTNRAVALYLHVPFCRSLCYYCACNKIVVKDDSMVKPYLEAVSREVEAYAMVLKKPIRISQFHWGGGTPNFLSPGETRELFSIFRSRLPIDFDGADISVEVDPRIVTEDHLIGYRSLGFTRISVGVQDFDRDVQEAVNRIQPHGVTVKTCELARSLGFQSINLDLIYGLPKQTLKSFRDTIEKVITIRPDRIALYGYAHVTWKKKVQKTLQKHDLPSAETRLNLFLMALEEFAKAGYVYIGMDHFALPNDSLTEALRSGKLNRNFMGYTTHRGADVLGFGVSSISSVPALIAQNTTDVQEYLDNTGFCITKGKERSTGDRIRGDLIEDILCSGELDIPSLNSKWNIDFHSQFAREILTLQAFEADELITIEPMRITVTALGRLFVRNIASVFDAYLSRHKAETEERFSKSI